MARLPARRLDGASDELTIVRVHALQESLERGVELVRQEAEDAIQLV
jgi:hypothetical protein